MSEPLWLPRTVAIRLMAEAQKSDGAPVRGAIRDADGEPGEVCPGDGPGSPWARYASWSGDGTPSGIPEKGRLLAISINTKGVLQLSCWERQGGTPLERNLKIRD